MANLIDLLKGIVVPNQVDKYSDNFKDNMFGAKSPETQVPAEDPKLGPNGPSLFDRVSKQIDNQEALGNVGLPPEAPKSGMGAGMPAARVPASSQEAPGPTAQPAPPIDMYGDQLNDAALAAAQAQAHKNTMIGNLMNASDRIGSALSRGAAQYTEIGKDTIGQSGQGVKDIQDRRKGKDQELDRQIKSSDLNDENVLRDSSSAISKKVREEYSRIMGVPVPDTVSAKMLKDQGINIGTLAGIKMQADARVEAAKQRASDKEERLSTKAQEKLDKDITHHSERLGKAGVTSAIESLQEVNSLIPGGIDGSGGDIPGYGLAGGMTPDWVASKDAQKLRQAVQRLANIQLKDRSGSAVSDQEYKRFQQEFGAGTWKTEQQLRNGLQQYRNIVGRVTKELEASAPQSALQEYKGRDGSAKSELIPQGKKKSTTSSAPSGKVRVSDGKETLEIDASDLEHAEADGFKRI